MNRTLAELPPPPRGRTGWPWDTCPAPLPLARPDGSDWPQITIVTPSFKQGIFIEETIRSVLLQGYPCLQYIVMDGGSKDETVRILEKYAPWIDHWESRPDGGQAAAINKGLAMATGTWFQNINSDDVLAAGALAHIGRAPDDSDAVCGDVVEFTKDATHRVGNRRITLENLLTRQWRTDSVSWHQPGVFLRRDHLQALAGYDESLHYAFDFHLTCRYVEQFPRIHYLDTTLAHFRIHDEAKSSAWGPVYAQESIRARELLSSQLVGGKARRLAEREAARRRLFKALSEGMRQKTNEHAAEALRLVAAYPRLVLDRMFLGSIRRSPTTWVRAWLRALG